MDKKSFKRAFDLVNGLCKNYRPPFPILDCVLLQQKNDELTLVMTDIESYSKITVKSISNEDFVIALPQSQMKNLLKVTKSFLQFAVIDGQVFAMSDGVKVPLDVLEADAFPSFEDIKVVSCNLPKFSDGCRVFYAASKDDTRFNLMALRVESNNGKVKYTATDGHRLSHYSVDSDIEFTPFLMPSGFAKFLLSQKCFDLTKSVIELGISHIKLTGLDFFNCPYELVTRLIDGDYPDYPKVFPPKFVNTITFDKGEMLEALKKLLPIATQKKSYRHNSSDSPENVVVINMVNFDRVMSLSDKFEKMILDVPAEKEKYDEIEFRMNINYLMESLKYISGKRITISISERQGAILIEGNDANDYNIIMPMRK